ncbi:hypothetical protein [Xanthomonas maliensis]|uniref:hypothetical protein n=1 Tax=Xanthomonas maliensis TaxID=1321368 RepID=UPI0009DC0360|nr:hypothetical protein [Xanthomonas maliensis]KAB7769183.1 hypothetical protein CKY51_07600 [Xanthomonas maliensis]
MAAPVAWAQGYPGQQGGREAAGGPRGDSRSFSDTIRRVQRSTGGQILGAESVPFGDRRLTRVKYMDGQGRVRTVYEPEGVPPGTRGPAAAPPPGPPPADMPPRGDNR